MTSPQAPAFPSLLEHAHRGIQTNPRARGLTKREAFAACALQGILSSGRRRGRTPSHDAAEAVKAADALIDALNDNDKP